MEKQKTNEEGKDYEKIKAAERTKKALFLLRKDFNEGLILLEEMERIALCGIVIKYCTDDYFFFCREILEMDLLTEKTHKRWCDDLQGALHKDKKRLMRLKPRGCFKSTIYGVGLVLWLWGCQSPQLRIFYTSANALLLNEISDKLNQYIGTKKNDTFFSHIFGIIKDDTAKNTSDVINIQGRSGKGFSLILRTAGSSTVGIHPNFIIVDDPLDGYDRDSKATRDGKERWFDSLTPLLVPFFNTNNGLYFETILYIGTRWHMKDLVYYILEKNKKYSEDQKWDVEIEGIYNEEGEPSYPEFFPLSKILQVQAEISDIFFACQYRNDPLPEGLQIFDLDRLTFVREEQVQEMKEKGEWLCVFDPALGKAAGDYPAVLWMIKYEDNLIIYDAIDRKTELALLFFQIAAKNKEYGCRRMRFENNNAILIEDKLREAHKRIDWKIHIDSIRNTSNKEERIISCQPDLYSGYVKFMDDYLVRYPEAMNQIVFFGAWDHDDFPDCMALGLAFFKQKHFKFHVYNECL